MNKQELRTYWKSLNIVFGAIFLGVLLFFVVANFVMLDAIARIEDQTTTFILGIVSIAFVLIDFMVIGIVADKIKLNTAETGNLVLDKLNEYRSRVVIKLVMMETSIFAAIIIYIFVQNYLPLVALVVGFGLMTRLKPDKDYVEEIAGTKLFD